ncbi:DUF4145 domain-containing protein [Xanthobacter autotrophicus]|uniref:DUF4145 domain-containing protein n=1 Tax=Xanthobacter autotrophicus TaxID=280 RepID=UPI00372787CB
MQFDRTIWERPFSRAKIPPFPCPSCKHGVLKMIPNSLRLEETGRSKDAHQHEDWEPDWIMERWIALFECPVDGCREMVTAHGDTRLEQVFDEDFGTRFESLFRPRGFHPAPPIIRLPENVPDQVRQAIESAFELYWVDSGSAITKLRASVERIMDDSKIPSTNKNGGYLTLEQRLDAYANAFPDEKDTLKALRFAGNAATHQHSIANVVVLDAFQIYGPTLERLYGNDAAMIKAIQQKMITNKGSYTS